MTALATQFTGFIVMSELAARDWDDHIAGPFFWVLIASYNLGVVLAPESGVAIPGRGT